MISDNIDKLPEKILRLQTLTKSSPESDECVSLEKHVNQQLMIMFYFLPQAKFGLSEEDASEFVLFTRNSMDAVINSYNGGNLDSYILKCIRNRLTSFYRSRYRQRRAEEVINYDYSLKYLSEAEALYRTGTEEQALNTIEPPGRSPALLILRNILMDNPTTRKRVFLFLASSFPLIQEAQLKSYCKDLAVDFQETNRISTFLKNKTDRTWHKAFIENSEKTRKEHYRLALQEEIDVRNHLLKGDTEKAHEVMDLIRHRKEIINRNLIKNRYKTLGYTSSDLTIVFGMCRGTIAGNICLAKKLLSWCINPRNTDASELRLSVAKYSGSHKKEDDIPDVKLSIFYPFKEFSFTEEFMIYLKDLWRNV